MSEREETHRDLNMSSDFGDMEGHGQDQEDSGRGPDGSPGGGGVDAHSDGTIHPPNDSAGGTESGDKDVATDGAPDGVADDATDERSADGPTTGTSLYRGRTPIPRGSGSSLVKGMPHPSQSLLANSVLNMSVSSVSFGSEELQTLYIDDPEKFMRGIETLIRRCRQNKTLLETKKTARDKDHLQNYMCKVQRGLRQLRKYDTFIEDMVEDSDEQLEAIYPRIQEVIEVYEELDAHYKEAMLSLEVQSPLASSDSYLSQDVSPRPVDQLVTTRRRTMTRGSPGTYNSGQSTQRRSDLLVQSTLQPETRQSIFSSTGTSSPQVTDRIGHSEPNDRISNILPTSRNVRFSESQYQADSESEDDEDVGSNNAKQTSGTIPQTEAWRTVMTTSSDITIINMVEVIQSIAEITAISCEGLGDIEVSAIDQREKPSLIQLKETLRKELKNPPAGFDLLKEYGVSAFKASTVWLRELDDHVKSRKLHVKADKKYAQPLKLEKFAGHKSVKTNIYEFLKLYEVVSRGFTKEEQAQYLYTNYLDDDILPVVSHVNGDYTSMKQILIDKYGDVNRLLSRKKTQIKSFKHVDIRSSDHAKSEYIKQYCEVLDKIQTLVDLNKKDYPNMGKEIFSHTNVMDISSLLPKFLYSKFSDLYVEERKARSRVSGQKAFRILLDMMKDQLNSLEFTIENRPQIQEKVESQEKNKVKMMDPDTPAEKPVNDSNRKKRRPKNTVLAVKTDKKEDDGKIFKAYCFVHPEIKKSIQECPTGKCPVFLNMKPADRLDWAIKKRICHTCFLYRCTRRSPGKCFYKSQLPQVLVCSGCSNKNIERNVLLCGDHKNDTPQVKSALKDFLADFDDGTAVTMMQLVPRLIIDPECVIMRTEKPMPAMNPLEKRENSNVFDVTTGNVIPKTDVAHKVNAESGDFAIYPMQTLNMSGHRVLVLYDSGAMGEAIKTELAEKVKMSIIDVRPQSFRVAGGDIVHTNNPLYETTIGPDLRGEYHTFSLLSMDAISERLPTVDLGEMTEEFKQNQSSSPLSKEAFPLTLGGSDIQLIIGIRQSLLFPTRLLVLPSGLQVWRSQMKDCFGSSLMFAGPHSSVRKAYANVNLTKLEESFALFFSSAYRLYREYEMFEEPQADKICQINLQSKVSEVDNITPINKLSTSQKRGGLEPKLKSVSKVMKVSAFDISSRIVADLLGVATAGDTEDQSLNEGIRFLCDQVLTKARVPRALEKAYEEEESTGCTVDYRCPSCSSCQTCKNEDRLRAISIKEEAEELLITRSVEVDLIQCQTFCVYPFTEDPEAYLKKKWGGASSNYRMAESVLKSQRNRPVDVRESVVRFHEEIHEKGFVMPLSELPKGIQETIESSSFRHYFCWRSVFKPGSQSTPSRLVVDPTVSSFNDVLAKGINCLTSLFVIMVNWRSNRFAFTSDISKMFNSLKLKPEMYKYSMYLFSPSLDPQEKVETWVNLTLMYGLKSAANQSTYALKEIATRHKETHPLAYRVIKEQTYMDDSSGGANDKETFDRTVQEVTELLPKGGFKLKVITKSGEHPCEKASSDGESTTFAGYKWKPERDVLMLNTSDMNFNPKRRGMKKPNDFPINTTEDVLKLIDGRKLTRRILLGKTLEVFDILGLMEPLKVRLKLDLQPLKHTDYDEEIPPNLREKWVSNLKLIHNARSLLCERAFIPTEAVDPEKIELLVCTDAATAMCGCAVYARFKLKSGQYSCQLITGRSKTTEQTIPRNELEGCALGAQTAYTVAKALGSRVTDIICVTDSTISLCWIANEENRLKQFVNTRVKLIHRLVGKDRFYHVAGLQNPADLLTRGDVVCEDVDIGSRWQKGDTWMTKPFEEMPLTTYEDLCSSLTQQEQDAVSGESHPTTPTVEKVTLLLSDLTLQMIALPDSVGDLCCEASEQREFCHCTDAICCMCQFPPEVMELRDSSDIEVERIIPTLKSHKRSQITQQPVSAMGLSKEDDTRVIDLLRHGFRQGLDILAVMFRFIAKTQHKVHLRKGEPTASNCKICNVSQQFKARGLDRLLAPDKEKADVGNDEIREDFENETFQTCPARRVVCSPLDYHNAWHFLCKQATAEVKEAYKKHPKKLTEFTENESVLFGAGRLSYPQNPISDEVENPLFQDIDFFQPVFLNSSKLTYAIVMYIHWEVVPHSGVERTLSAVLKIIHVKNLRKIVRFVRETCPRCRYLMKKHYTPASCNQAIYSFMRAPPFFSCMIDIAGTFKAHDSIKRRVTKEVYFLIQVCLVTGAVAIGALEDLSTSSVVMALKRSAARYGWSKYMILDNQSSFKCLESLEFSFKDLQGKLWSKQRLILDFSTPLAHNEHGRVESKVKVLKDFLEKSGELGQKHSYLEWETVCMDIAAAINGLPICHNQDERTTDDVLGLITPNMFLIGRNNNRAPDQFVTIETNPVKALKNLEEMNIKLFDLLGDYVHRFIPGKNFSKGESPEVGDIVLFVIKEAERTRNVKYRYGKVIETAVDGRVNKVKVTYKNPSETIMREADRNVKDLVLIHGSNEIDFNSPEHCLAASLQKKYL